MEKTVLRGGFKDTYLIHSFCPQQYMNKTTIAKKAGEKDSNQF